jgi:hypothetical protein
MPEKIHSNTCLKIFAPEKSSGFVNYTSPSEGKISLFLVRGEHLFLLQGVSEVQGEGHEAFSGPLFPDSHQSIFSEKTSCIAAKCCYFRPCIRFKNTIWTPK